VYPASTMEPQSSAGEEPISVSVFLRRKLRTRLTSRTAVRTKLVRPTECEVWAAESKHLVAASQGSRGTSIRSSIFWCARKGKTTIVRVSRLEKPLSVGGEGEKGHREESEAT
jgi:hypothetical protein